MSDVQLILKEGQPEYAVLPYNLYTQLVNDAEMLQDIQAYDDAKQAIANGEELIPSAIVYAIMDGENPIKVWREYRGFTQQELAKTAVISPSYLSQIETGKREGTTAVLQAIARALNVTLDDIVSTPAP